MLPLLHALGGFKRYELLNAYKYKRLEIRGAYTIALLCRAEIDEWM